MMQPFYQGYIHVHQGNRRIFNKWKKYYCAVFERNRYGMARLELYANESQLTTGRTDKVILLDECIAIRPVTAANGSETLQVQLRNGQPNMLISAENLADWQQALSKSAFPDQFTTIRTPTSPMTPMSPMSDFPPSTPLPTAPVVAASVEESAYDTPWDCLERFHVLLLQSNGSLRPKIPEGSYDLCFRDSLLLKDGPRAIEAWAYNEITWFGIGDNCFAIRIQSGPRFEFKCNRPTNVYEALRTYLQLVPAQPADIQSATVNLLNIYTRFFVPIGRRVGDENIVTDNAERQRRQSLDNAAVNQSLDSPSSQKKSSRFSFFRRKSTKIKKPSKAPTPRNDFEKNANNEWLRYQPTVTTDSPQSPPAPLIAYGNGITASSSSLPVGVGYDLKYKPIPPPRPVNLDNSLASKRQFEQITPKQQQQKLPTINELSYYQQQPSMNTDNVGNGQHHRLTRLTSAPSRYRDSIASEPPGMGLDYDGGNISPVRIPRHIDAPKQSFIN